MADNLRGSIRAVSKPQLDRGTLCLEATLFAKWESSHHEPSLFGVTDGKAVGTYLEHKFQKHLEAKYSFGQGNSAKGIDLPSLDIDLKVTSIKQPQSSCPYKSARQKVWGLGYGLLVFVYDKCDDGAKRTCNLRIVHIVLIEPERTADYQMTRGILEILDRNGNEEPGRDHNARAFSFWMAGGGVKGGQAYGATDPFGNRAVENKVHVHDIHATILHQLGIDHERLTFRSQGLDFKLTGVDPAKVVKGIIA